MGEVDCSGSISSSGAVGAGGVAEPTATAAIPEVGSRRPGIPLARASVLGQSVRPCGR
jgi:hypothetical protein